jgi:hypothetical protein
MDFFPQFFLFGGVFRFNHALREDAQFLSRELALAREFKRKPENARLFRARQVLDLFNDAGCCHAVTIIGNWASFK